MVYPQVPLSPVPPMAMAQVNNQAPVQPWRTRMQATKNKCAPVLNGFAGTFAWLFILTALIMLIFWIVATSNKQDGEDEGSLYGQSATTWFQAATVLLIFGATCQLRLVRVTQ
ncbi:MAG: hypothetical protein K0U52_07150 [Gammaproteobacteria bacterium]|nr:hypothetical protein [Gammaproteobacteria bacterium]